MHLIFNGLGTMGHPIAPGRGCGSLGGWNVEPPAFPPETTPRDRHDPSHLPMPQSQRPIILSLTTMHESGMSLLREASELRMASGTDPETLRHEPFVLYRARVTASEVHVRGRDFGDGTGSDQRVPVHL